MRIDSSSPEFTAAIAEDGTSLDALPARYVSVRLLPWSRLTDRAILALMAIALLPYVMIPVELRDWDPLLPEVAARLIAAVREVAPDLLAEHIGSSSVPGLAGKGYVDLQLPTPAERIPSLTEALVAVGWQRQTDAWAFPPTRPMLKAEVEVFERRYKTHLHIVPEGAPELDDARAFREALLVDPDLRARYVARKRMVIKLGTTLGPAYAEAKSDVVLAALRQLGRRG